jgi:hypothetical protein
LFFEHNSPLHMHVSTFQVAPSLPEHKPAARQQFAPWPHWELKVVMACVADTEITQYCPLAHFGPTSPGAEHMHSSTFLPNPSELWHQFGGLQRASMVLT